ncbi:hypothetical protein ACF5W4_07455 [Bacillota bacterium Lsc_1132]
MTLKSPEHMLDEVFSSSIIYSLEILEEEQPREELLSIINDFLEKVVKINEIKNNKEAVSAFLKEYGRI